MKKREENAGKKDNPITVARKLMKNDKGKTMTQSQLADEINRHVDTVRGWERGRATCKDIDVLEHISSRSGVTLDFLRGKTKDPYKMEWEEKLTDYAKDERGLFNYIDRMHNCKIKRYGNMGVIIKDGQRIVIDDIDSMLSTLNATMGGWLNAVLLSTSKK